jgi:hypothetical protein
MFWCKKQVRVEVMLAEIQKRLCADSETGKLVDLQTCDLDTLRRVAPSVWQAATV